MKINIEHNFTIQAAQKIVERCTPEVMRDMRFIVVDAGDGAYYFRKRWNGTGKLQMRGMCMDSIIWDVCMKMDEG